jgi:hypothetical protein
VAEFPAPTPSAESPGIGPSSFHQVGVRAARYGVSRTSAAVRFGDAAGQRRDDRPVGPGGLGVTRPISDLADVRSIRWQPVLDGLISQYHPDGLNMEVNDQNPIFERRRALPLLGTACPLSKKPQVAPIGLILGTHQA